MRLFSLLTRIINGTPCGGPETVDLAIIACKDCGHSRWGSDRYGNSLWICTRREAIDYTTGKTHKEHIFAHFERTDVSDCCGTQAKYFVPKVRVSAEEF